MSNFLNFSQIPDEIKKFVQSFPKCEQDSAIIHALLLSIYSLQKYPKLTLLQLKSFVKSSQQIAFTHKTIESFQLKISELQQIVLDLEKKSIKVEKSTETENSQNFLKQKEQFTQSETAYSSVRKTQKKVDFWNQTEEKENLNMNSNRACWKKEEIHWVQDFSSLVKNVPKPKSPIIRESRISILSNQDKAKRSSGENYY